jgi:Glycosyltransferase family 92
MLQNKRRWVREWIEFHLMMGAEHFIIYDNNSTDLPLEVLQYYIDQGQVTYIPWPPKEVPPPEPFNTPLEEWQYSWFKDCLETCLSDDWVVHRQVPCQLSAFADAIRRTKGGVSRWFAAFDVDEYIFPRPSSGFKSLAGLLQHNHAGTDHISVYGNTFGTSGHIEHAARRKHGSPLPALVTESYTYRADYDRIISFIQISNAVYVDHDHPYANDDRTFEVESKGQLGTLTFVGANSYIVKYFANPDMVSHCLVHTCNATSLNWVV